jgi:hypothetical protein
MVVSDKAAALAPVDSEVAWCVGPSGQAANQLKFAECIRSIGNDVSAELRLGDR